MKITVEPSGIWYHGSNVLLQTLRAGSTITQWRALAEAFSHKPAILGYDDDGSIIHNGREYGYLYEIAEPVIIETDIYRHPHTTMDLHAEYLTRRPLRVKRISEISADPADQTALDAFIRRHSKSVE